MIATPQTVSRDQVERLVREALRSRMGGGGATMASAAPARSAPTAPTVPTAAPGGQPNPLLVNVSARHVHVTQADLETLFGPGARLTKLRDLYQDGEFASEQRVNIVGPRNRMVPNVRILGPCRDYSQVELSYTDAIFLGMDIPLGVSGRHDGTPGCIVVGPHGAVTLRQGLIRPQRHVHMCPADLAFFGVRNGDLMKLRIDGPCGLTFDRVLVREHPRVRLEVHIDTDEGNACHLTSATHMELIK